MKPVYVINGFLESGKTQFITYTIAQPYFQVRGKTLLIVCEEGMEEYDPVLLKKARVIMETIEEESAFNTQYLLELEKKHKPERIVIEFNGMWNYKNVKFPWHWTLEQQITMIDASTFPTYYTNMRSLLAEMIRKSELIIFNRCDGIKDLSTYKRNIKVINPDAQIVFEDSNGEVNEIMEEELPYDLKQSVIEMNDPQFAVFYMDVMDHPERYADKTICFVAQVMIPDQFPEGYFVPGRMAMTCCADDVTFLGYACEYDRVSELKNKQWIKVSATVTYGPFEGYRGEGPLLHAVSVTGCKVPKEEMLQFI